MKKPFKITTMRWSAIGSWEWDKEQWYQTYVLGKFQSSPELLFGSAVDLRIQNDPTFLPDLPRYPEMQHRMKVTFGDLTLTGTADGVDLTPGECKLADYKTGKTPWTLERTQKTGQILMYLLQIYLSTKINPEEFRCFIHWLPTAKDFATDKISFRDDPVVPITFEVRHTMAEVLNFSVYIQQVIKEMEAYCIQRQLDV